MSPEDFKQLWQRSNDQLSPISREKTIRLSLLPSTIDFLTIAGLPKYAAPNLSFANDSNDRVFGINKLVDQYNFLIDTHEYEKYVVIGSCRDGDVIAVNTMEQDLISQLDHEDLFSSTFFNSSIETLADFLIIYRDFESSVTAERGEEGYRSCYFTDIQFDELKAKMLKSDRRALIEEGFWKDELEIMLHLRQQNMDR